jgi:hypothetical protein
MTPDVYRPSRGALEPWLFEGKGTTKKQAM